MEKEYLSKLNPEQREAATHDGNALIVSIPGSGKTTLLMSKIAYIFDTQPNAKICAVTFTKKAAEEMQERVKLVIGKVPESKLMIKTFNSVGIWQYNKAKLGRRPLIKEYEAKKIVGDFLRTKPQERSFSDYDGKEVTIKETDEVFQKIGLIKVSRAYRNNMKAAVSDKFTPLEVAAYERYQNSLKSSGRMDFTDQILLSYQGMLDGNVPFLPYTHLLIDEFQDSDELQVDWAIAHAKKGIKTTIVGDDDQAIYLFRGASGYNGFTHFKEQLDGSREIVLQDNYRSHQEILTSSQKLIEKNKDRLQKELRAFNGDGGSVHVFNGMDEFDVTLRAGEIIKQDTSGGSWCVLTRNNNEINFIAQTFQELDIPYVELSNSNPLEMPEIAILLSMCENIDVNLGLLAEQIMGYYGVKDEVITQFRQDFSFGDMGNLFNGKVNINEISTASLADKHLIDAISHIKVLERLQKYLTVGHYSPVIDALVEIVINKPKFKAKKVQFILPSVKKKLVTYDGTLKTRVRSIKRFYEERKGKDGELNDNSKVILMTAHSSKGLEFDQVIIPFLNEDTFPMGEDVDSERRLCFVAMTRAKKRLFLGHQLFKLQPGTMNISDYISLKQSKALTPKVLGKSEEVGSSDGRIQHEDKFYTYYPVNPSRFIKEAGMEPCSTVDDN
jgi:superfamily I DNA/RNA helicase